MCQAEKKAVRLDCKIQKVPEDTTTRNQEKETEKEAVEDMWLGGNRERDYLSVSFSKISDSSMYCND